MEWHMHITRPACRPLKSVTYLLSVSTVYFQYCLRKAEIPLWKSLVEMKVILLIAYITQVF